MFTKRDFALINVANIPNSKEKLDTLLKPLNRKQWCINELCEGEVLYRYGCKPSTMRKVINHCAIIGILEKNNHVYFLSDISLAYITEQIDLKNYILELINTNEHLSKVYEITKCLLSLFDTEMSFTCIYTIFSLVFTGRNDSSAIASCGRNLRAIFSLFYMAELIEKRDSICCLKYQEKTAHKGLRTQFKKTVISTKQVFEYVNRFFDSQVTELILKSVTTYENDKYIWVKSSLFKNAGEIKNLNNEYIGTLMIKERQEWIR